MIHSVSLGTDPLLTNHNPVISSPSQALKVLTSPPGQTKSLDNSNTLKMFNNNTYTNFKTAETRLYINEILSPMNESNSFNCRKLKRNNIIHACYTREGIDHIKQEESSKPFKIFHISKLYELFLDYVFVDDEKGDVNTSVLSSY